MSVPPVTRRRTVQALCASVVMFAVACYLPSRRVASLAERGFYSFRFENERNVTVIAHAFALDTARTSLADLTGLGGRVTGYFGDTLLVEPYYLTWYDAGRSDHQRTFGRGTVYRLPDIVLVAPGDDVAMSDYAPPVSKREHLLSQTLLVVPNLLLLIGMTYQILRRPW